MALPWTVWLWPTGRLGLWLDSPMIEELHGPGTVKKELPAKFIQFERHGIDISKEPMLVYPTLHYQNGGVNVNGDTETNTKKQALRILGLLLSSCLTIQPTK
jgi:succinate dehydrogenase/fumarate reductase flavoprotein subunit